MKYYLFLICTGLCFTVLCYCTPEEEELTLDPGARLAFSTDTLFFDTLFTDTVSFTRRLKVFNPHTNAVRVSDISLAAGNSSSYLLIVNGKSGNKFQDQIILGEDSLLILVQVEIPSRDDDTPFLVEDSIIFATNTNLQRVNLVAWGQDAHFFRADSILACDTFWPADKPYVLYGSILIDTLCSLTIQEGAQIFVNRDAAIFVGGTLLANGTTGKPVLFRNIRLDIANAPGQWVGIIFLEGSKDNQINQAIVRNAETGVRLGTPDNDTIPDLTITNTIIENMSGFGILAFTSDLLAYNLVVDNCIEFCAAHFAGGNYYYQHATFGNYSVGQFSESPALIFTDNLVLADNSVLTGDLQAEIQNSIIWGDHVDSEELLLDASGGAGFGILIEHCLLRSRNSSFNINNNLLAVQTEFPRFIDPGSFDYQLDTLSPAKDRGQVLPVSNDLLGRPRDSQPDLGAYERIE